MNSPKSARIGEIPALFEGGGVWGGGGGGGGRGMEAKTVIHAVDRH